jgi:hypothetical protein
MDGIKTMHLRILPRVIACIPRKNHIYGFQARLANISKIIIFYAGLITTGRPA